MTGDPCARPSVRPREAAAQEGLVTMVAAAIRAVGQEGTATMAAVTMGRPTYRTAHGVLKPSQAEHVEPNL